MIKLMDILKLMEPYQHVSIYTTVNDNGDTRFIIEYAKSEVQSIISTPIADKEVVLITSSPLYSNNIGIVVRK